MGCSKKSMYENQCEFNYLNKEKERIYDFIIDKAKKINIFSKYKEFIISTDLYEHVDIYDIKWKKKGLNIYFYINELHRKLDIKYTLTIKKNTITLYLENNDKHFLYEYYLENNNDILFYNEDILDKLIYKIYLLDGYDTNIIG